MSKKLHSDLELNNAIRDELGDPAAVKSWQLQRDCWFFISKEKKAKVTTHGGDEPGMTIEFAAVDGKGEVQDMKPAEVGKEKEVTDTDAVLEQTRHKEGLDAMAKIEKARPKPGAEPAAKAPAKSKKAAEPAEA